METKFNFTSGVCTSREQSERLLALGLKKETADCYYWQENDHVYGEATGVWHLETLDTEDTQEHFEYLDKYFGVCLADDEEHFKVPAMVLQFWQLYDDEKSPPADQNGMVLREKRKGRGRQKKYDDNGDIIQYKDE